MELGTQLSDIATFKEYIDIRFGGKLSVGTHLPDGVASVLEAYSLWKGKEWTDDPIKLGFPFDIRPLNNGFRNDKARTTAMVALVDVLLSVEWTDRKIEVFAARIAARTLHELMPAALWVLDMDEAFRRCSDKDTVKAAGEAWALERIGWSVEMKRAANKERIIEAAKRVVEVAEVEAWKVWQETVENTPPWYASLATQAADASDTVMTAAVKIWIEEAEREDAPDVAC